jgi:hypothetical protein
MINKSIVDAVVIMLQMHDVDGETMEHIINEVGMRDQMIKQLTPQDDIVELEQDEETVAVFTRQQLINFTRDIQIQERCKQTVLEAINNSGIDFDDMVELELNYNKTIEVNFDDHSLYKELESAIDEALETDSEAIYSEALDVIENMKEV